MRFDFLTYRIILVLITIVIGCESSLDLTKEAKALIAKGEHSLAEQKLSQAIELDDNNDYAHFLRAISRAHLKDSLGALTDFNRAIQIEPDSGNYYYQRALLKDQMGLDSDAISDLDTVIQLMPNASNAYYTRAVVKLELMRPEEDGNKLEEVEADLDSTISIDPNNEFAHFLRGVLDVQNRKDTLSGLTSMGYAINISPMNPSFLVYRGKVLFDYYDDKSAACTDWWNAQVSGFKEANQLYLKHCGHGLLPN